MSRLARFSYIATGFFFLSVALVFYQNPWLVDRAAVASDEKLQTRQSMLVTYMATSVALGIVWLKVAYDEAAEKRRKLILENQAQSQEASSR